MKENTMTVEQVLTETVKILGSIMLPVNMDQATSQIRGAITNLQLCVDAIARSKEQKAEVDDGGNADSE